MTATQVVLGAVGWLALTSGAAWLGSRFPPDEWYKLAAFDNLPAVFVIHRLIRPLRFANQGRVVTPVDGHHFASRVLREGANAPSLAALWVMSWIHGFDLTFRPVSGTTTLAQKFNGFFNTLAASGFHLPHRAGRAAAEPRHILPGIRDGVA